MSLIVSLQGLGAKPGMVIFVNNKTILVDPDEALYERLAVK